MNTKFHGLLLSFLICAMLMVVTLGVNAPKALAVDTEAAETIAEDDTASTEVNSGCIYLSDISYLTTSPMNSASGWNGIKLDENYSGDPISLIVDGETVFFMKGVAAHASSNLYYDLTEYNQKYDYFIAYVGVDASRGSAGNGIIPWVYSSETGANGSWKTLINGDERKVYKGTDEALFIQIPIKNIHYLRLQAYDNGSNSSDHAVWADAKLVTTEYLENIDQSVSFKTVAEYDSELTDCYQDGAIAEGYKLTVMQREFVSKVGYHTLKNMIQNSPDIEATIDWLMNDEENLSYYLIGGTPEGTYQKSILTLDRLLALYKDDMSITELTSDGSATKGDLYKRLIISLSLTHSSSIGFWAGGVTGDITQPNDSDAVERYKIYKDLYEEGKLRNDIFESLSVEEMRFVVNNIIDDESIKWLNFYSSTYTSSSTSNNFASNNPYLNYKINPYTYITYQSGWNYYDSQYYDLDNYEKWDAKYHLTEYGITYQEGFPKPWIVFEENGVCGALSKTGSNLQGAYGIPSSVVSQPGHAAYIYMILTSDGTKMWNLYNDVSGWAQSGKTERLWNYMPAGWGYGSYASTWPVSYFFLSQEALNDFDTYKAAEEILMLADIFEDDTEKLEEIYRRAIEIEPINFDAWYGLVNLYKNDQTKTEEDYYKLAEQIADVYTYHPLPMYDLLRILNPLFTSAAYDVKFTMLQTGALTAASKATSANTLYVGGVKAVANSLLGTVDQTVALFSFDGDNAGKLMLADRLTGNGVQWEYSLDGGVNWTETNADFVELSNDEISSITADNDIKIHIIGVDRTDENIFTIDITKGALPTNLYRNDYENRIMGTTNAMQWRRKDLEGNYIDSEWTYFKDENPRFEGSVMVEVRVAPTGTCVQSDTSEYRFYADNQPDTRKYIYIENLSLLAVSSAQKTEEGGAKAIDGFASTIWHTKWDGSDYDRWISIELAQPKYISAVQYLPRQDASNGRAKGANVYVSLDGETWELVATATGWLNNGNAKDIDLETSVFAKYVKFEITDNWGDGRSFGSAAMINLFEDTTKSLLPEGTISYSIKSITDQNVTATLNVADGVTITNNDGSNTYVFTDNGEFTFEIVDQYGYKNTVTATVTWIHNCDKVGHIEVIDKGYAATCTEAGLSDGKHCSVCGEVLVKQETIPMTEHSDKDNDGQCDNCGKVLTTSSKCSCICHSSGFKGFIYKVIRVFWKLFRINKTCSCGAVHW